MAIALNADAQSKTTAKSKSVVPAKTTTTAAPKKTTTRKTTAVKKLTPKTEEVKTEEVKFIAGALGNPVPDGASVEEIGKYAYDAALKLMKDTGVPSLQDLKLNLDDLLREVPAEVVMQMDIFKKLGFGVCTCPLDITEEDVANVLTRAYYENHFPKEA